MIGCDVVDISRIETIFKKNKSLAFLNRVFNDNELKTLNLSPQSVAGYYAAKEAASKALGCGISKECEFKDILISKNHLGKPMLDFSDKVKTYFKIKNAHLSISHDAGVAMAVVMLEFYND